MSTTTALRVQQDADDAARTPAVPPAAEHDEPAQQPATPRVATDDPDAAELAAALAAVADEEGARATQPANPAAPPAQAAQPATSAAPAAKPGPVPYERFADLATKARQASEQAAYWKGVAEARGINPAQEAQPAPQPANDKPMTLDEVADVTGQLINQAQQHIEAAGQRFDQGEGNFVDFLGAMFAGMGRTMDARDRLMVANLTDHFTRMVDAKVGAAIAAYQGAADRLVMQQQLQNLKAAHPYLAAMTDDQLKTLATIAKTEAAAAGKPIGTTQADTLRLRQHIAGLTDLYGPRWHPNYTPAATAAPPATAQPPNQQQPATPAASAPGPAAVARKAALAAAQPPTAATASGAHDRHVTTIEDVDKLTDEEIEALPAATRQRLLSG